MSRVWGKNAVAASYTQPLPVHFAVMRPPTSSLHTESLEYCCPPGRRLEAEGLEPGIVFESPGWLKFGARCSLSAHG